MAPQVLLQSYKRGFQLEKTQKQPDGAACLEQTLAKARPPAREQSKPWATSGGAWPADDGTIPTDSPHLGHTVSMFRPLPAQEGKRVQMITGGRGTQSANGGSWAGLERGR